MNISVFGLGYVGVVTAACLAKENHRVYGVDISEEKVHLLNKGKSPIIEDEIESLVEDAVSNGLLTASITHEEALKESDLVFVCVGTPSRYNGSLDTFYVEQVCQTIAEYLFECDNRPTIIIRSTMLPGSMNSIVSNVFREVFGEELFSELKIVFHPEFLREGTSVYDFYNPPKIVCGENQKGDSANLMKLYRAFDCPKFIVDYGVAEMVKYCDNLFHAVKIAFANEVGQFSNSLGIDSHAVMSIFKADTKLNISDKYLTPGFSFGGSCLPKDLRAFNYMARNLDVDVSLMQSVLISNQNLIDRIFQRIKAEGFKTVSLYGIAFKKGTDDLRESPLVSLVERLTGSGIKVKVYDNFVQYARLLGGNKSFVEQKLPHISRLLTEKFDELLGNEILILGHTLEKKYENQLKSSEIRVMDLNHPGGPFYNL